MSSLEAFFLGIIQGLTEFLPVSSSGHLEIGKVVLGSDFQAKESLMFAIALHVATALSSVFVFRKEIVEILKGLFAFKNNESFQFSLKIILSMIPAVLAGLFLEDFISALFDGNLILVGVMLLVTALLLFWADRTKHLEKGITYRNAAIIGIVQAIAILPGISRSGATIALAVILGIDREKAARFSFLMVLPLIFGSMTKSLISYDSTLILDWDVLSVGFVVTFITGVLACRWMITLVKNSRLKYFGIYCVAIGSITLIYGFL